MKFFLFFLLFCSSFGFSYEITQGTLSNGISYYLCPSREGKSTSITVIVKRMDKEKKFELFDFFEEVLQEDSQDILTRSTLNDGSFCFNAEPFSIKVLREGLPISQFLLQISKFLECPEISNKCIEEMREEFLEDLDDDLQILFTKAIETDFIISKESGFDKSEFEEALFLARSNDEIRNDYRTLFTTSPMAIIIEGIVDVNEFERLFGGISRNVQKNPQPIDSENNIAYYSPCYCVGYRGSLLYEYNYSASTFRDQVLKDLFLLIGCQTNIISGGYSYRVGNLGQSEFFGSRDKISTVDCSIDLFDFAKNELAMVYQINLIPQWRKCVGHFISGISENLKPNNQNLIRELDALNIDEFHSFMLKYFSNIQYVSLDEDDN